MRGDRSAWMDQSRPGNEGLPEGLLTMSSGRGCLGDGETEEYLFERLSEETREGIEEHLLVCGRCQERVEEEGRYMDAVRRASKRLEGEELARAVDGGADGGVGWRERVAKVWGAMAGRRVVLALASVVVVAGILYNPWTNGPVAETAVELSLARGAGDGMAEAPAEGALRLSVDVTELSPQARWRVEVVNAGGGLEQSEVVEVAGGRLSWRIDGGLKKGQHWVRLREPRDGALVREFGMVVR